MKEVPIPRSQDVRKLSVAHDNPAPVSEEEKIRIQLKQEEAERLAYERELQLKREDAKRFREMEVASVTRQGVEDYGTAKVVVNQPTEELSKPSVPVVIVTASANSKASELSHPQATPKKGLPRRPPGDTNFYRVIPEEQSYGSRRVSADRHEMLERRGVGRGRYESFDRRFPDDMREGTGRRFPSIDREGTGRRFQALNVREQGGDFQALTGKELGSDFQALNVREQRESTRMLTVKEQGGIFQALTVRERRSDYQVRDVKPVREDIQINENQTDFEDGQLIARVAMIVLIGLVVLFMIAMTTLTIILALLLILVITIPIRHQDSQNGPNEKTPDSS